MIRNLTPHPITLRGEGGDVTIPPSGVVARVSSIPGQAVPVEGLPVPVQPAPVWGPVEGLPDPQPGVALIVSGLVRGHCSGRTDVFSPGTGPNDGAIRNERGHVVAVTRLNAAP